MHQEVEVVITLSESKVVCQLQYRNTYRLKKVYVEMVRQIVESEAKNDEDAG